MLKGRYIVQVGSARGYIRIPAPAVYIRIRAPAVYIRSYIVQVGSAHGYNSFRVGSTNPKVRCSPLIPDLTPCCSSLSSSLYIGYALAVGHGAARDHGVR